MYAIKLVHQYYPGTFNVPKDSCCCHENGDIVLYSSKEEAEKEAEEMNKDIHPARYVLAHGEAAPPQYTVVEASPHYVVERSNIDDTYYTITTERPAYNNRRINGYTTGLHGVYGSIDEAREEVHNLCDGEFRTVDPYGDPYPLFGKGDVETYRKGLHHAMEPDQTLDWLQGDPIDIEGRLARCVDSRDILDIVDDLHESAHKKGWEIDDDVVNYYLGHVWTTNLVNNCDVSDILTGNYTENTLEGIYRWVDDYVIDRFGIDLNKDFFWDYLLECSDKAIENGEKIQELDRDDLYRICDDITERYDQYFDAVAKKKLEMENAVKKNPPHKSLEAGLEI